MLKGQSSKENSKVTTKEDKSKELTKSQLNETDAEHSKSDTTFDNEKDTKSPKTTTNQSPQKQTKKKENKENRSSQFMFQNSVDSSEAN